ncbi:MAG TPA: hypothetical protein VK186_12800 [Candidatus Deferrimicrobium sp.]|nr:hypothetical protein [Candidatus Deferrimicrobium sp.]
MTEINGIYELRQPIKGWPVEGADSLNEASKMIFGSPYWEIPEDRYMVIDKNTTYSLLAVFSKGKASPKKRYLAVNMDFLEYTIRIAEMTETESIS